MTRLLPALAPVALAGLLAAAPGDSPACAPAPRDGEYVRVSDEAALIVWDEAAGTEHFVRRATFEGTGSDFGFLVPTPTRPDLEPADDALFSELSRLTAPRVEHRRVIDEEVNFGCAKRVGMGPDWADAPPPAAAPDGGVRVLDRKRVGNLDAAVLGFKPGAGVPPREAAAELLEWLARNGYAARPDLTDWAAAYARDGWVVTAFKMAGPTPGAAGPPAPEGGGPGPQPRRAFVLDATAVRMSFKVPDGRPFFPYREPAGQRAAGAVSGRLLRVFVAAPGRVEGKLGDGSVAWPGETVWANAVAPAERDGLLARAKLPAATGPAAWWVTEFEDHSSPRPAADEVYFGPSPDPSAVARPPVVRTTTVRRNPWWVPALLVVVPFALAAAVWVVGRAGRPGR